MQLDADATVRAEFTRKLAAAVVNGAAVPKWGAALCLPALARGRDREAARKARALAARALRVGVAKARQRTAKARDSSARTALPDARAPASCLLWVSFCVCFSGSVVTYSARCWTNRKR